jgi:16S rRNA (cytidine1402-2'-O)-methyltransferase
VASEDTRHTGKLLTHHGIRTRQVSLHEHNEAERSGELIRQLQEGARVALVSDAGTPLVSDPGYRLVTTAAAAGIRIVPVPGPSSLTAALSVSGLPTDTFRFVGFLPRKKDKRAEHLSRLAAQDGTLIFFESPRRIENLLAQTAAILGDRSAVLCREMTKRHEEYLRGRLTQIRAALATRGQVKGECTLLVGGRAPEPAVSEERLAAEIRRRLTSADVKIGVVAREIARELGVARNTVYRKALEIRDESV